jgi:hypothetical protein
MKNNKNNKNVTSETIATEKKISVHPEDMLAAANGWAPAERTRTGKFSAYADTIKLLRSKGASCQSIADFLNANGVECSLQGLAAYVRKNGIGKTRKADASEV